MKVALSAMPVKTDRNDARGLAQLTRLRRFRLVHCKSMAAQEALPLPTAHKLVQLKPYDIERSLSGCPGRLVVKIRQFDSLIVKSHQGGRPR